MPEYKSITAAKIKLRERGWKWNRQTRRWQIEVNGVRIEALYMDAALAILITKI